MVPLYRAANTHKMVGLAERLLGLILVVLIVAADAARDPFAGSAGGGGDRVALNTPYGRIVLRLLSENAPRAAALVLQLAQEGGCGSGCKFYRAEARPNAGRGEPPEGPPYALLQGNLQLTFPASEGRQPIAEGSVCFIPSTSDFFIALGEHPGWGDTMSVFAEVEDFVSTDLIAVQYYHNVTHPEHGTVMRMMDREVSFEIGTNVDG